MPIIDPSAVPRRAADPDDNDPLGAYECLKLAAGGGLTQFGVNLETLPPGSQSSETHWHEEEDEFVYILSGTGTLIEGDVACEVGPGTSIAFPRGRAVGHHIENRGSEDLRFWAIGTSSKNDVVHYTQKRVVARIVDGVRTETEE